MAVYNESRLNYVWLAWFALSIPIILCTFPLDIQLPGSAYPRQQEPHPSLPPSSKVTNLTPS